MVFAVAALFLQFQAFAPSVQTLSGYVILGS